MFGKIKKNIYNLLNDWSDVILLNDNLMEER